MESLNYPVRINYIEVLQGKSNSASLKTKLTGEELFIQHIQIIDRVWLNEQQRRYKKGLSLTKLEIIQRNNDAGILLLQAPAIAFGEKVKLEYALYLCSTKDELEFRVLNKRKFPLTCVYGFLITELL